MSNLLRKVDSLLAGHFSDAELVRIMGEQTPFAKGSAKLNHLTRCTRCRGRKRQFEQTLLAVAKYANRFPEETQAIIAPQRDSLARKVKLLLRDAASRRGE